MKVRAGTIVRRGRIPARKAVPQIVEIAETRGVQAIPGGMVAAAAGEMIPVIPGRDKEVGKMAQGPSPPMPVKPDKKTLRRS